MVKGQKSSASSGTRKKHARKAGGPQQEPPPPKEKKAKGKDKGKNKEPRKKVYIPPVKPAPIQPDPLETLGLASQLPPELLIILRSLRKKDAVTKTKALEELQFAWVDRAGKEGDDSITLPALKLMLPVWIHHLPSLFLNPSRRIRLLTGGLHYSILRLSSVRDDAFTFLREFATSDQLESVLGSWCMAAHDIDRQVSLYASKSWGEFVSVLPAPHKLELDRALLSPLVSFLQKTVLDPEGIYLSVNPPQPVVSPPQTKKGGGKQTPTTQSRRREFEETPREAPGEDEEKIQDRKARLRIGALGAVKWLIDALSTGEGNSITDIKDLLSNPATWSSLYHAHTPPFVELEGFGYDQPAVRRVAWLLLQGLLKNYKDNMEPFLPVLSSAVLRSAWVEPDASVRDAMWSPLLTFLTAFPRSWEIEGQDISGKDEKEVDSEESGSDEDEEPQEPPKASTGPSGGRESYREFLQFLELGCSGSPLQGYPTVLVILSTIPSSVLKSSTSDFSDLFTSFWAAIDGRALSSLDKLAASAAFLSSLLESLVFLVKRLRNDVSLGGKENDGIGLVRGQFARVGEDLTAGRLQLHESVAGRVLAKHLTILEQISPDLLVAAWDPLGLAIKSGEEQKASANVLRLLGALDESLESSSGAKQACRSLIQDIAASATALCGSTLQDTEVDGVTKSSRLQILVNVLDAFSDILFMNEQSSTAVDTIVGNNTPSLMTHSPQLILSYLKHRKSETKCHQLWVSVLASVAAVPATATTRLAPFLEAAQNGALSEQLKPRDDELDNLVSRLLGDALEGSADAASVVRRLFKTPDHFLSNESMEALVGSLISAFNLGFEQILRDADTSTKSFEAPIELLAVALETRPGIMSSPPLAVTLLPDVFLFAYLLPKIALGQDVGTFKTAQRIWSSWVAMTSRTSRLDVLAVIKEKLHDLLLDIQVRPLPDHILQLLSEEPHGVHLNFLKDVIPSHKRLSAMLESLPSDPIDPSLTVLDPLVPPPSVFNSRRVFDQHFDSAGYSGYARVIYALLQFIMKHRQGARENTWALLHLLALATYAQDFLKVPSGRSAVFSKSISKSNLEDIISKVHQVATYLLSSPSESQWHLNVIQSVDQETNNPTLDYTGRFLADLIKLSKKTDTIRDCRILSSVLQPVLSAAGKDDADQWMLLARRLEKTAPETSLAIVFSITQFGPEPPRLDRYRNELAAGMLAVPPSKANSEGLSLLRKLAATAPDPESDVVFLSQQRAINLIKACQQWISSDEDIDEEVESAMTLIFSPLLPILQNVPGGHWDFIFDVLENNLENGSFEDVSTLVVLTRTLRVVIGVQDLVSTNKGLRATWQDREPSVLSLIRNLLATKQAGAIGVSAPSSICVEQALSAIQDMPGALMDQDTLSSMCHLLVDRSVDAQKMAYHLLHEAAKKRTEYLVIEAGVDGDTTVHCQLPGELLEILQRTLNQEDLSDSDNNASFGYLLGWMITFDLFTDASFRVKSGYIEQLRDLDIIASHFLPSIFEILGLYGSARAALKLDIWGVDEFHIPFYDPDSSVSLQLLAAHLYYRALLVVPSLIRSWLQDCKDRTLQSTVTNYTSQHFSPVIIRTELTQVVSPESEELLAHENLTVKVANNVSEVTASFAVDEHQLEITIKLPSDWPLHRVEVRDSKRVGVEENRWRAWVLGVHQIMWSQSGTIVDGLNLFKKNVSLHFEGQVECAICYSIISPLDDSLPKKPCRTCKNRFHAACLYKWFNSSHSSTCPLCRSDIF
ncbi:hypothetical protein JAAARDRAFT_32435 [Jaapia argillacea MUCL 33604]|uniref:E3 ubiquitin-protein ligase listerin n=1 Tax=Jaapia argillacea MUCL 33604 TaxID=933084 RepID=A0A067Q980_9AGAM|nr:hypothetical protein JAAARDRAFT_32435 [Jaapia argillacea MUCL 33604]